MWKDFGINKVRMMTNNPLKIKGLEDNGISVQKRFSHVSGVSKDNKNYLETKKNRMGHML